MVLEHIADYLDTAVIRSVENTNNVLSDIFSSKKDALIRASDKVVKDYRYQPNSIINAFR